MIQITLKNTLKVYTILSKLVNKDMEEVSQSFKFKLAILFKKIKEQIDVYYEQVRQILDKYELTFSDDKNIIPTDNLKKQGDKVVTDNMKKFLKDLEDLQSTEIEIVMNKIKLEKNFKYFNIEDYIIMEDFIDFSCLDE